MKIDDRTVQCKLCLMKFAYHSSTTVMLNHLARRHPKPSSQQGSIANFTVRSCDSRRAERISGLLAKMIAGDMLPMSVVEGTGLRNLISFRANLHSAMSPNDDCEAGENVPQSSSLPPRDPVLS